MTEEVMQKSPDRSQNNSIDVVSSSELATKKEEALLLEFVDELRNKCPQDLFLLIGWQAKQPEYNRAKEIHSESIIGQWLIRIINGESDPTKLVITNLVFLRHARRLIYLWQEHLKHQTTPSQLPLIEED